MENLTPAQIETINTFYIRNIDKFFRMFAGLSSRLNRYEDGVRYLGITNNHTHILSTRKTAVVFAYKWKNHNPELNKARGFVVVFKNSDAPQGFAFKAAGSPGKLAKNIAESIEAMENGQPVFESIFPGVFAKKLEDIKQDVVEENGWFQGGLITFCEFGFYRCQSMHETAFSYNKTINSMKIVENLRWINKTIVNRQLSLDFSGKLIYFL